jgi:hypothetical protein
MNKTTDAWARLSNANMSNKSQPLYSNVLADIVTALLDLRDEAVDIRKRQDALLMGSPIYSTDPEDRSL